ncbi:MAG: hypothetical protein JSV17_16255 [Candidatus Aminicenantes bacterium]|nr:MAG: hypothetical protein JSV17_16255 [Candidatus Aminicenantes bacterium]
MIEKIDRERIERFPLGVVIIAVVLFFVALGTASYWVLRWIGKPVAETLPVGPEIYRAFVYPDIVLSGLLVLGAIGLLKLKKFGFVAALLALGMWFSDLLLIFGLTKWDRISFVGPCLLFVIFSIGYLWLKKHLFQ